MEQTTPIERRKKILLRLIPIGFGVISAVFIYLYLFTRDNKTEKSKNTVINTSIVNKPAEEIFTSKVELYSSTETKVNDDKTGKDNFLNVSDNLSTQNTSSPNKTPSALASLNVNTNTDEDQEANMRKRMRTEVAPMAVNHKQIEPVIIPIQSNYEEEVSLPKPEKQSGKKRAYTQLSNKNTGQDLRNGDFNSFSYVRENNTKILNSLTSSPTVTENYNEPVNCPAFVIKKTKINGNTVIIIELLEQLTLTNGKIIEKGTRIAGSSTAGDNRVKVTIESINVNGKIEMVHLIAYDIDGMEGLMVKNARAQSGATNGLNGSINTVTGIGEGLLGIPGQLAGGIFRSVAGTNRGGSVFIPAGYKLILRSGN